MKKSALSKEFIAQAKVGLLEKQDKFTKQLINLKHEDPFSDPDRLNDNAAVDADAAEQFEHQRVEAIVGEIEESLLAIQAGLDKIEAGSYGNCEKCGQSINQERLAIEPYAKLCILCQQSQSSKNEEF